MNTPSGRAARRRDPAYRVTRVRRWSLTASAATPVFILAGIVWLALRALCLRSDIYNPLCETGFALPVLAAFLVLLAVGWTLWHQFRIGRDEEQAQPPAAAPQGATGPAVPRRLRMHAQAVGRQWRRGDARLPAAQRVQRRLALGSLALMLCLFALFLAGTRFATLYFHPVYVSVAAVLAIAAWLVHSGACLWRLWRLRRLPRS